MAGRLAQSLLRFYMYISCGFSFIYYAFRSGPVKINDFSFWWLLRLRLSVSIASSDKAEIRELIQLIIFFIFPISSLSAGAYSLR